MSDLVGNTKDRFSHRFTENARCPFADKCTHAHSVEELEEWKERFKFKRHQLQLAKEKHLHGNTYPEQLMEKLMTTEYPKSVVSYRGWLWEGAK